MRKWYKFSVDSTQSGTVFLTQDQDFIDHQNAMGGYQADEAYRDRKTYFEKYFFGYQYRRFEYYNDFLRKALNKRQNILSVASGRCTNELYLMQDGYRITCSDLDYFSAYQQAKKIFPDLQFKRLDCLRDPFPRGFEAVVVLSLIYLFNQDQFMTLLKKINAALPLGGTLVLDSAGSPDNPISHFINEGFLKFEMLLRREIKSLLKRRRYGLAIKDFGYRRSDADILQAAEQTGFRLIQKQEYAFLTEFRRSLILNSLIPPVPVVERLWSVLGKKIPYVRMFQFEKVNDVQ